MNDQSRSLDVMHDEQAVTSRKLMCKDRTVVTNLLRAVSLLTGSRILISRTTVVEDKASLEVSIKQEIRSM